jgi:hypothetical protein
MAKTTEATVDSKRVGMLDLVVSRPNDRAAPDGLMSGRHSAAAETDLRDFDTTY